MRIVVAEDNEIFSMVIRDFLKDIGHQPLRYESVLDYARCLEKEERVDQVELIILGPNEMKTENTRLVNYVHKKNPEAEMIVSVMKKNYIDPERLEFEPFALLYKPVKLVDLESLINKIQEKR